MNQERGDVLNPAGKHCQGCGSFVSSRFSRVFGDNDDQVYRCHKCASMSELLDGGAVNAD